MEVKALPPRLALADAAQIQKAERVVGEAVETNMERTLAQAPNVLRGYLAFEDSLAHGSLRPRLVQQIAIAVAELNQCVYCLSAHAEAAASLRVGPDELKRNRRGESEDARTHAALQFVLEVAASRGAASDAALSQVRDVGFSDAEVIQLVALLALNTFTNHFNRLARPALDFPTVDVLASTTGGGR